MIFKSSEIRWFSKDKEILWNLYENLSKNGPGIRESDRTDYYLHSGTVNTWIKIREGNHELKIKRGDDENAGYGVIEHWIKWSTSEEKNILNTIGEKYLGEWIAVQKKRYKKSYEIEAENLKYIEGEFVDEGCGAEFTEICIPSLNQTLFTFGFEAFSSSGGQRENLITCLDNQDIDKLKLEGFSSYGYPEMLATLIH